MSAKPSTVRRIGVGLVLASAALVSTSCAAGQHAATATEQSTLDGINGDVGKIALRGVAIAAPLSTSFPSGADVTLKLVIVNGSGASDSLVDIKSPAFASWAAFKTVAEAQAVLDADTADIAEQPSATPSSSAPSTAPAQLPVGTKSVEVAPGESVGFDTPSSTGAILLQGLTGELYPAASIPITFTFEKAGSITVRVPVQISQSPHGATVAPAEGEGGE